MSAIDVDSFEMHNVEVLSGVLRVRRGFIEACAASALEAGSELVGGWSIEDVTGSPHHYCFVQSKTTRALTLYMTDEAFNVEVTYAFGVCAARPPITKCVQNGFILINSPAFAQPAWGYVGGGLIPAVKVASTNPDTTALDIPVGLTSEWGARCVVATGNILFVNDASATEMRTFVAQNAIPFPAQIYGLHENQGALLVVTSDGVFALPTDATGLGQLVEPFRSQVSSYGATNYRLSAKTRGAAAVITKRGIMTIPDGRDVELQTFGAARALSSPIGAPSSGDYRYGSLWPSEEGFWLALEGKLCRIHGDDRAEWAYAAEPLDIVGMLRTAEGADLIVTPARVLQLWGNADFTAVEVTGVVAGTADLAAEGSQVVRFLSTSSDNTNRNQRVAINGEVRAAATPAIPRAANVIGTDVWDGSFTFLANQMRSRRHAFAQRADDLNVEIGVDGCCARVVAGDVEFRGQGRRRP